MKGNNFQIIILVVFIAVAIFGVLIFSGTIPIGEENNAQGTVVLWGTIKSSVISSILDEFNRTNTSFTVKYVEKSADSFDADLLEALASGNSPDMFFITDDLTYKYSNKIYPIPYTSLSLDSFKNTFVGAGEIFLNSKGIVALPMMVDPMVTYYSRSILDSNGIAYPPIYWEDFKNLVPILNKKDENSVLVKSAVALGQFSNISHAKEILTTMFMQTGNKMITENSDGSFVSNLGNNTLNLGTVVDFYTSFSNPQKDIYSWNKSFADSKEVFSSEKLAFYFGFASELNELVNKNPNQNFMVTYMPQVKNSNSKLTYGKTTGIAISSSSKNLVTAFTAANLMSSGDFSKKLAEKLGVSPARRELLKDIPKDNAYTPVFYSSALFAKSWLDPQPKNTDEIFKGMIDKILSNSLTPEQAISDLNSKISLLLIK